jgi:cystathionine beta-lyase family protein involved in aluminum resistance
VAFFFKGVLFKNTGGGIANPGVGLAGDKGMMQGWVRSRILRTERSS